jgi:gliding motility-associated-like protein
MGSINKSWFYSYVNDRSTYRLVILCFSFFLCSTSLFATHIVGGEIGYRCLGNNNFEITLRVFRDCFNAADGAYFDDPASIGVFNREGLLISTFTLSPVGNDTLSEGSDPCLTISTPVCVHTTTYKDTINLLPRIGGYRFVYQRCCRNQTIVNIINPLETGATFDILLTEAAMIDCNSSPVINSWPPVYVCNNRPLLVNSKALDENFDSLVYKFCTPFQGATFAIPQPVPPDGPPYDSVVWVNPTYSLANILGGSFPLVIDSKTGIMTGVPQTLGQFVVGVCIEEYDKVTKALLSETRRDFQYNVVNCTGSNAAFSVPDKICRNSEVTVFRENPEASTFEWYLGEGEDKELISRDFAIKLKFDEIGFYVLTLITDKGQFCESIQSRRFQVIGTEIDFSINKLDFLCENFSRFSLNNVSVTNDVTNPQYLWTVSFGNSVLTSTLKSPVFDIPLGSSGRISLKMTASNCVDSLSRVFSTSPSSGSDFNLSMNGVDQCLDSLVLQANATLPVNEILWLNNDNKVIASGSPISLSWSANRPSKLVAINNLGCKDTLILSLSSLTHIPFSLNYPDSLVFCDSLAKKLIPTFSNSSTLFRLKWTSNEKGILNDTTDSPTFVYPLSAHFAYVSMLNTLGCEKLDSVKLIPGKISLLPPFPPDSIKICANNEFTLEVKTLSSPYENRYLWTPVNVIKEGQGSPTIVILTDKSSNLQLNITNTVGCSINKDFNLNAQTFDPALDTLITACTQSPIVLNPGFNPSYTYLWAPGFGLSSNSIGNPIFSSAVSRNYKVTITNPFNNCKMVKEVAVKKGLLNQISLGNDTTICDIDNYTLSVNGLTSGISYIWSKEENFNKIIGTGKLISTVLNQGLNSFFVKATDAIGCVLTDSIHIRLASIMATMPSSLILCKQPDTAIVNVKNMDSLQILSYDWFPKGGLFLNPLNSAEGKFLMRDSGRIGVSLVNQYGCRKELNTQISLSNNRIPVTFSAGRDSTLCNLGNIEIKVNTNIPVQPTWSKSPTFNTILSKGDKINYTLGRGVNTLYVMGENTDKCVYLDTINLFVFPIAASMPDNYSVCLPSDTIKIQVTDSDTSQFLNYLWAPNGVIKSDPLEGPIALAQITKDTTVSVLLMNKYGCESTLSTKLTLINLTVKVTADVETLIKNKGDKAIIKASGCAGCQYIWSPFNTLNSLTDSVVTAMPNDTTIYKVIASKLGCSVTGTIRINVDDVQCEEPNIFVPNAFTPNNDGNNDALLVRGRWITSLRFVVYNRYGQELFTTNNQLEGWDGTYKGKDLGPDVFGYYLTVRCLDGGNFAKRGNVTLIK